MGLFVAHSEIKKDQFMGFNATLTFPRVDALAKRVAELGTGAFMFKIDFFCQLPIDPGDYSLLCFSWKGKVYFDKVSPQGLRSAPFFAQCTSNAISIGGSRGACPAHAPYGTQFFRFCIHFH